MDIPFSFIGYIWSFGTSTFSMWLPVENKMWSTWHFPKNYWLHQQFSVLHNSALHSKINTNIMIRNWRPLNINRLVSLAWRHVEYRVYKIFLRNTLKEAEIHLHSMFSTMFNSSMWKQQWPMQVKSICNKKRASVHISIIRVGQVNYKNFW